MVRKSLSRAKIEAQGPYIESLSQAEIEAMDPHEESKRWDFVYWDTFYELKNAYGFRYDSESEATREDKDNYKIASTVANAFRNVCWTTCNLAGPDGHVKGNVRVERSEIAQFSHTAYAIGQESLAKNEPIEPPIEAYVRTVAGLDMLLPFLHEGPASMLDYRPALPGKRHPMRRIQGQARIAAGQL